MPAGKLTLFRSTAVIGIHRRRRSSATRSDRWAGRSSPSPRFAHSRVWRRLPNASSGASGAPSSRATCRDSRCDLPRRSASRAPLSLCLAHPRQSFMSRARAALMPSPSRSMSCLACGAERFGDERLTERLAQLFVGPGHAPAPPRLLALLAEQRPAEELEVGVDERLREHRRGAVEQVPSQVGLDVVERRARRRCGRPV